MTVVQVDEKIVESLQELGISLYEARLYVGLLKGGPQNGNELSRASGVPSSKVYAMLERLENDGVVTRMRRGNTIEYACVPPDDLLHKLRERYSKPLEHLEETLPMLGADAPEADIVQIRGVKAIIEHARALARSAQRQIYMSVWQEYVEPLRCELEEADERGVQIVGMIYGVDPPSVGWWQRHSYQATVASRISGRMLTIVVDGDKVLIAHIPASGEATAVRTSSPVLTLVAEEYLIHEFMLQRAKTMTGYEEWDRWLRTDVEMRTVMLGRTGQMSSIEPEAEASGVAPDAAVGGL